MSRRILLNTAMVAVTMTSALPASAQRAGVGEEPAAVYAQNNSPYCKFTYFSNAADNLEFQGSAENRCFDMKGGDDVLILNREAFPAGVRLFTGSGRDTVWTTDADDMVRDPDGNDKEIRTYGGNDRIEIEAAVDDDPNRGVNATERTEIRPGTGDNEIVFGKEPYSNAFARYSPDVWLTTAETANDQVDATCGRPTILGPFDFRSMEVPETSSVSYKTDGCNVGIFGLYGDADINMSGGRLALQTYSEGFRIPAGENLPKISGEVRGGLSLTLDLNKSDPASQFNWEGSGSAFIRSQISAPGSGGSFGLRSAREISYQGDMDAGDVLFDFVAKGVVKLDLVSNGGGGSNQFKIAASRMDVSWRLSGDGGFPEITNDVPVTYMETSYVIPDIDWSAAQEKTPEERMLSKTKDPDKATVKSLPMDVPDIEEIQSETVVSPGNTRLRLQLRRDNDRFGKCVSINVLDLEGILPDRIETCRGLAENLRRLVVESAEGYELIVINGDGVDLTIPINASSHFVVNRIEADL